MRWLRLALIAAAALLAGVAAGCWGGSSDRAGGTQRPKTVVLTLSSHEGGADVREWIDAVERLSHGSLRIELKDGWRRNEVDPERATIADVRRGKVDLASIPARAYDTLGVRSFQGLLAPFLIDSYALERTVLAGDVPGRMLLGVKPLGVVGVALLPGGLQKVLSFSGPMLAPSDYRAQPRESIGIPSSEAAADTFRALGARFTNFAPGDDTGQIAGIEQDLVGIVANHYQALTAGETLAANVNFRPDVTSIVMNAKADAALSPAQRKALRDAGREALVPTMRRLAHDERAALDVICAPPGGGPPAFFLLTASPSNLAALRDSVRPVYRRLGADRVTGAAIAEIEGMKQRVAAEGAPRCRGTRPSHARATAGALRVSGALTATDAATWEGVVTSTALGRGRLVLERHLMFRSFVTGRLLRLTARFAGGELRGCVRMSITPTPQRDFAWDGPGVIVGASRPLRRYVGLSLRFAGTTQGNDLRHVRGGFVSDAPSELPCDFRQGV